MMLKSLIIKEIGDHVKINVTSNLFQSSVNGKQLHAVCVCVCVCDSNKGRLRK